MRGKSIRRANEIRLASFRADWAGRERFGACGADPAHVVVLFPDGDEFFLVFQQDIHQTRIEMLAALFQEMDKHLVPGPGLMVDPLVGQGVEHVGHGHDAAVDVRLLAHEALRIALPVPTLMVQQDDARRSLDDGA